MFAVTGLHLWQGWTWLLRGEFLEAEALLRLSIDETERYDIDEDAGMAYACGFLARVLLERRDVAGAAEALARAGHPVAGSDADALCTRSQIELLLAQRRYQEAMVAADGAERRLGHIANPGWLPWRTFKALAGVQLDQRESAAGLLETELANARRWGAPGTLGAALRHCGEYCGEQRGDTGLDLLREAVQVTSGSLARLEHAKALASLGAALRRSGGRTESRAPLGDALELATVAGARPLAEYARTELLAAGGRRRSAGPAGMQSLTPSERRVAELTLADRPERTVGRHVGIRGRSGSAWDPSSRPERRRGA